MVNYQFYDTTTDGHQSGRRKAARCRRHSTSIIHMHRTYLSATKSTRGISAARHRHRQTRSTCSRNVTEVNRQSHPAPVAHPEDKLAKLRGLLGRATVARQTPHNGNRQHQRSPREPRVNCRDVEKRMVPRACYFFALAQERVGRQLSLRGIRTPSGLVR